MIRNGYLASSEEDVPLGGYALLLSTFTAVFGGLLVGARSLPRRTKAGDILLLGIATHKLARLITRDSVTAVVRFPFTRYQGSSGAGEVDESPRGRGLQKAIGTLLTCPYCIAPWVATAFMTAQVAKPRATRLIASTLAIVTISDVLNQIYVAARRAT